MTLSRKLKKFKLIFYPNVISVILDLTLTRLALISYSILYLQDD